MRKAVIEKVTAFFMHNLRDLKPKSWHHKPK